MSESNTLLPFRTPLPDDRQRSQAAKRLRWAAYGVLTVVLIATVAQFHRRTVRAARRAESAATNPAAQPDGKLHAGAIGRWRSAADAIWAGQNIYLRHDQVDDPKAIRLHPNMPAVVIALTPFASVPPVPAALAWNLLKLASLAATVLALAAVANHKNHRVADWVLGLGLLWALPAIVGDIQHGNTNIFVLAALAGHLWLYRRGKDFAAGAALAGAVCLKMTPALFLLYWLYQRNWRLLAGAAFALAAVAIVLPAAALGPQQAWTLTATWLENVITPGLLKGQWYPEHINQSLPGVASRYFLTGASGDIFYNPENSSADYAASPHQWITILALNENAAKWLIRLGQAAILGLMAWAVGRRRLARDDGRRMLHYGMVACGMMLLNQRTWDHHAAVMLIPAVGAWYALTYGAVAPAARRLSKGLMVAALAILLATRAEVLSTFARLWDASGPEADHFANVVEAYGPGFCYFLLMFAAAVTLSAAVGRSDHPYGSRPAPWQTAHQIQGAL